MKPIPPFVGHIFASLSAGSAIVFVVAMSAQLGGFGGSIGDDLIGPSLTGCCLSMAVFALLSPKLQCVTFTLWIAAGVTLGMSFPTWFLSVGDFKFTRLFVPILQIIMFGMGTTLSIADFARVLKMPRAVFVGLTCQFTIMPCIGWLLAYLFGFPPEIAAGLILVGVSPSGLASNVMAYIAKANLALSVTMTAASTLLAPILTPLLMQRLAGEMIEINVTGMMWSITRIVLLPVLAGLIFHELFYDRFKWLDRVMPMVSMVGIFIMTVLTVATGQDNLLKMGVLLIVACLLHCGSGFVLGYLACRSLGMDKVTCRTISLEVGLQNSGMASGIAAELKKVATLGLAPIVFGPVMNITASTVSNWWRTHPVSAESGKGSK
jgi:BASS family bile acid:Na+ symporter